MDFEKLVTFLRDNWPTIIATVVIVTPVLWLILHFLFKQQLESLNKQNELLRHENDALTRQLKEGADASPSIHSHTIQEGGSTQPSKLSNPETDPGTLAFLSNDYSRDADKNEAIRSAVKYVGDSERGRPLWSFHEVLTLRDLDDDGISLWKGIFLAIPYSQIFDDKLIARLVRWVREGGHLVATGFELGERHNRTNINQLTYHFGISFNSDVVVGSKFSGELGDKGYDASVVYDNIAVKNHPLFQDVRKIALKNACSLHLEPGAQPLLLAFPNQILELEFEPGKPIYSRQGNFHVLAPATQRFRKPYADPKRSIAALAPAELTEKGKVLIIGTWDFRSDGLENDNDRFLGNLWRWLVS